MRYLRFSLLAISLLGLGASAASAAQPNKTTPKTNVAVGKELFHQRCSICHGERADGNGTSESGSFLEPSKVAAANLTALSARNGGTFPADRVRDAIFSKGSIPAHGTPEMPAWGNVFYDLKSRPQVYEERVRDLTAYIESVQGPHK